eukprot:1210600-Pyramimonas_sp.AAC.1
MRAAFPSIEHNFLREMLGLSGLPLPLRNAIRAFCAVESCCLRAHGERLGGFCIFTGIRQG